MSDLEYEKTCKIQDSISTALVVLKNTTITQNGVTVTINGNHFKVNGTLSGTTYFDLPIYYGIKQLDKNSSKNYVVSVQNIKNNPMASSAPYPTFYLTKDHSNNPIAKPLASRNTFYEIKCPSLNESKDLNISLKLPEATYNDTEFDFLLEYKPDSGDYSAFEPYFLVKNFNATVFQNDFIRQNIDNERLATLYGVNNTGELTSVTPVFDNVYDNLTIRFPAGIYLCDNNTINLSGLNNLKIIFEPGAVFIKNVVTTKDSNGNDVINTYNSSFIKLSNCKNVLIDGLNLDLCNTYDCGILLNNSNNVRISNCTIKNIGYPESTFSAGIELINNCSYSTIDNVTIDSVEATKIGVDGYSHMCGISITNGSYNESKKQNFSKHIRISNCNICGSTKEYDDPRIQLDCIYIIQRPDDCFEDGTTVTYYEKAYDQNDKEVKVLKYVDKELCTDCDISIINCNITYFNCRAIKASARGVKISGCHIDCAGIANTNPAVDFQFCSNSYLKNSYVHSYYSVVGISYDIGMCIVSDCTLIGRVKQRLIDQGSSDKGNINSGIIFNRMLHPQLSYKSTQGSTEYPLKRFDIYTRHTPFGEVIESKPSVIMSNLYIENIGYAIRCTKSDIILKGYSFSQFTIQNITIGHLAQDCAIYLSPEKMKFVDNLVIENISFDYASGSTAAKLQESIAKNNFEYFNYITSSESPTEKIKPTFTPADNKFSIIKLTEPNAAQNTFVNPIQTLSIRNISGITTEHEQWINYNFTSQFIDIPKINNE